MTFEFFFYFYLQQKHENVIFFFIYIYYSSITTPSVEVIENDFNTTFRRSSTGVLLSPEVDVSSTSKINPGEISESDGIWILKKDSQRRQTLFKVFSEDEKKICDTWMEKIENDRNEKNILQMVIFFLNY